MVFKKKGTEEVAEISKPSEEVKEEKPSEEVKEEKTISAEDILINHENRLRDIESTLYKLRSI